MHYKYIAIARYVYVGVFKFIFEVSIAMILMHAEKYIANHFPKFDTYFMYEGYAYQRTQNVYHA